MKLPVVLAGPFLRRTEFDRVYVWIACSEEYEISAELYQINKNAAFAYDPEQIKTSVKTVRLGEKLFISIVKLEPISESFPIDQLLGYNIRFTRNRISFDLGSLGVLSPGVPDSIVYGNLKYPTFYISERPESKLFYGSCRKLHGTGGDSLAGADILLEKSFLDLDERPEALFLMGDQIYADDAAGPLMPFLMKLGETVTGRKEDLAKVEPGLSKERYKPSLDKIYGRKKVAAELCKFSSRKAANHLLRFGEYAAMYLLSFNPELWKLAENEHGIKSFEEEHEENAICIAEEEKMDDVRLAYHKQLKDIKRFAASLPRVRRLLANIPSYMIFDDHDITDDWNFSYEWRENVWNAPLGRHVIANGLSAYWAFQGWGNNPDSFDDDFSGAIGAHLNSLSGKKNISRNWEKKMWNFNNWHFTVPTYPTAVFLDTRTQRAYRSGDGKLVDQGPQLINELGWLQTRYSLIQSGWEAGDPLIVVSPAPLYGIGKFESMIRKAANPLKLTGFPAGTALDMESWRYNGRGFESFHEWVMDTDPEYCLILSGDSHFAFSLKADVSYLNGDKKTLYQFTSSPMKNKSFTDVSSQLLKTMLHMHSLKNTRKKGNRDKKNTFHIELDYDFAHETVAKETIHYNSLQNGPIIEAENNLGLLSVLPGKIDNALVTPNGEKSLYLPFPD
ncbi:hypothetical protein ELQ35_13350 [Peribacillus cavernae]|uniref:PhoD-like phosphatase metallophosphatase domain-containing protein n=1 Tax=Peribacillus cavernae TaxID=1674310 RepID=A0A433HIF8_9BACI|nr:hypothetical protein [Peribacillus cavernae]MDQ0217758.1 hypothetical protein [Peribacillus cavernae]RUQ28216.1 hypothetical protein ELQ35_13350 [Peribacillus cavernae]